MAKALAIPCVVDGRALWNAPYSAAFISVSPQKQRLVWVSRDDLVVESQKVEGDQLKAVVCVELVKDKGRSVVVAVNTSGQVEHITVSKDVLRSHRRALERKNPLSDRKIGCSA